MVHVIMTNKIPQISRQSFNAVPTVSTFSRCLSVLISDSWQSCINKLLILHNFKQIEKHAAFKLRPSIQTRLNSIRAVKGGWVSMNVYPSKPSGVKKKKQVRKTKVGNVGKKQIKPDIFHSQIITSFLDIWYEWLSLLKYIIQLVCLRTDQFFIRDKSLLCSWICWDNVSFFQHRLIIAARQSSSFHCKCSGKSNMDPQISPQRFIIVWAAFWSS